jgi:methylated-DNA-protein-cysteine methyltransferase-like protein
MLVRRRTGSLASCVFANPEYTAMMQTPGDRGARFREFAVSKTNGQRPSFQDQVIFVANRIPYGRVTTYGRSALVLGAPRSARMVGWAMSARGGESPAHRVVNRNGFLSGARAWGNPGIMRDQLLEEEVPFLDEWTVDLAACVWDPSDDSALVDEIRTWQE